jgi:hypothetical protein
MVGQAGVHVCHDDTGRTDGNIPGGRCIDPADRIIHIPLAASRIIWIVRGEHGEESLVRDCVGHIR